VGHRLREASVHVVAGHSVVAPLIVEGLPARIEALGTEWRRKREFHLTVLPRAMVEAAAGSGREELDLWDVVTGTLSGRRVGPVTTRDDVRRVTRPDEDLRTLIVMVEAPGLIPIYRDLSAALKAPLTPPPAHVTLYSTDLAQGIGIESERQLADRAAPLTEAQEREVRHAMSFDTVFEDNAPDPPITPAFIDALEYAASVHRGHSNRGRDVQLVETFALLDRET